MGIYSILITPILTFVIICNALSLPQATGPFHVGSTEYLLPKITLNDPVHPNGTGIALLVRIYFPTIHSRSKAMPYVWDRLADLYEDYFGLPSGSFGNTTAHDEGNAIPLSPEECERLGCEMPETLPTLIFNPPFAGPPSILFFSLFSELVSHGYCVVTVDHPYEQPYLEYRSEKSWVGLPLDFEGDEEFINRMHEIRIEDTSAVMRALPGIRESLDVPFNLTQLILLGHSLGGSASLSQILVERNNSVESQYKGKKHILGAVNIDGTIFGPAAADSLSADLRVPSLLIASEGHTNDGDPSWPTFLSHQSGWIKEVRVLGKSNHTDFSDLVVMKQGNGVSGGEGAVLAERMVNITRRFVADFINMVVRGGEGVLSGNEEVRKEWPEVVFEYNGTGRP